MGAKIRSSTATSGPSAEAAPRGVITFDGVTVTGTENLMMAASLAEGRP